MRDLIAPDGEEDWFDDEGNWTEKGVAVLGSYIQSLKYYQNGLDQASDALDKFNEKSSYEGNEQWFADNYGIHSEQEYYEYLQKLTDEQYEYAKSVSDTEQDIASMYESSIDAAEEYINTLVESYNDYINVVKESLDAERDLYNFKKDVQKQTKDIGQLERRIAALSGSTNASDIAERRKLEAELYESRESLNDTYYEHSMDSQQEALDKEAQAYEEAMNKFVENLRTNLDLALEDMDGFMAGVTAAVTANAPLILDEYGKLGISLDSAIVAPWQAAKDKMADYTKEDGLGLMNSWTASGGVFDTFANNATTYLTSIWDDDNVDPGNAFASAITSKVEGIKESIRTNVETIKGYWTDLNNVADTSVGAPPSGGGNGGGGGGGVTSSTNVMALQEALNTVFNARLSVDGKLGPATTHALMNAQTKVGVTADGKYGSQTRNAIINYIDEQIASWRNSAGSSSAVGQGIHKFIEAKHKLPLQLAKGTMGLNKDQWALDSEPWLGDELVLVPGANGNLSFMRKGTSVVPADITANLVEWGKLNPDMLKVGGGANINMISNAVTKPEFNLSFEALVKADRIDEGTLPEVKKFVQQEINSLVKQMNYAIKKFK